MSESPRAEAALARLMPALPSVELTIEAQQPGGWIGARYLRKRRTILVDTAAERALSDDALTFMIAHELGHVFLRRVRLMLLVSLVRVVRALRWLLLLAFLTVGVGAVTGDGHLAIASLMVAWGCFNGAGVVALVVLALARRGEYRADRFAVRLVGSDAGAGELFKWLNSRDFARMRGSRKRRPQRVRTHPLTGSRLIRVRSYALDLARPVSADHT